jgi:hypothetical protein
MSQNSLVLPTSGTLSGLAAVEAVNAALDTLNTLAAGASAPSTPEAGQLWHDTTNNLLKIRSVDNTAWIRLGTLDETNHIFAAATSAAPSIYGLTLSNDVSAPASVLDIAAGGAFDATASTYMKLATPIKKNLTAAWAPGTGNGSLDTGSFQASTGYHVHLVTDPATGAVDVLTSQSFTNPVLPAGYTTFVPIGAIYSNASSVVTPFIQAGNRFIYKSFINDAVSATLSSSSQNISLSVPHGVSLKALLQSEIQSTLASQVNLTVTSPLLLTAAPNLYSAPANGSILEFSTCAGLEIFTNTSGQVTVIGSSNQSGSTTSWSLYTLGFDYPRGLQ